MFRGVVAYKEKIINKKRLGGTLLIVVRPSLPE